MSGRPSSLCTEQMLMILPRRRGIMWRATAWPTRNTLSTLVLHQLVPVRLLELVERRAALHAGVVDEDVDGADVGLDAPMAAATASAEVTSKAAVWTVAPSLAQPLRGGLLELGGVARVQDDAWRRRRPGRAPARSRCRRWSR